jgi:hypothetical protein
MVILPGTRQTTRPVRPDVQVIEHLVRARGVGPHACFFVSGEGELLPDGMEALSGFVLDRLGRVYAFCTGWDQEHDAAAFTLWELVEPDPAWLEDSEYQRALDTFHLRASNRQRAPSREGRRHSRVASIAAFA